MRGVTTVTNQEERKGTLECSGAEADVVAALRGKNQLVRRDDPARPAPTRPAPGASPLGLSRASYDSTLREDAPINDGQGRSEGCLGTALQSSGVGVAPEARRTGASELPPPFSSPRVANK